MEPLQLMQRVFKSKGVPTHPLLLENAPNRPRRYGLWKVESLEKAIIAVEKGTSIRRAAEMHGIPRSTLHDHISGRLIDISMPNPVLVHTSRSKRKRSLQTSLYGVQKWVTHTHVRKLLA